ncbi:MAG TPA: hypothetical protein VK416_06960, partial [Thermoanaerobaculia bacterium]|nr:hypothetical protein [Thermoanaerobaculia bacterium]
FDRQFQFVGERGRSAQCFAGVRFRRFSFLKQFGERVELPGEIVQAADRVEFPLVGTALPEDFLGLLRPRPKIRGGSFSPQLFERAPRGVLIKGSPEATGVAPRRS